MSVLSRRVALAAGLLLLLASLATTSAVEAEGRLAWPHFLKVHIENRNDDTRVIIDAGYAGRKWISQPGVQRGDHLIRIDSTGFVRSLDAKLAFTPVAGATQGLTVYVQTPNAPGADAFPFTPGDRFRTGTPSYAAGPGNTVTDVMPYIPMFGLPMDFEFNVGAICRPNQYLQIAPEYTNTVWRTPDGTPPGRYRARLNPDGTVTSLDGKLAWTQVPAQPWDWGHQILGVLIVHSCDPAGDGADVVGFGRHADTGLFDHMTTWDQVPDGGYGWQPFNCGSTGVCSSSPRPNGFAGGNWIVQSPWTPPAPAPPPVNLSPERVTGSSLPAVSVAASQRQFAPASASSAVVARVDSFADALAGIPLALAKNGPLLLTPSDSLDAGVAAELRRAVRPGAPVYLLGGTAALSQRVEDAVGGAGFSPRRLSGAQRYDTAVAVASEIGPASTAFVVNAWNYPDALSAGSAAGAVSGGAHVLLVNPGDVPAATRDQLARGGYRSRIVFGGAAAVGDAVFGAVGGTERIWGAERDATAAAAATRFFPQARTVWLAGGSDFVGGITGGAFAARGRGPLLLAVGGLRTENRAYLQRTQPGSAYVMAALDDGTVAQFFGQPAH